MSDTSKEAVKIVTYEMEFGVHEVDEDLYDIDRANTDMTNAALLIRALTAERTALQAEVKDVVAALKGVVDLHDELVPALNELIGNIASIGGPSVGEVDTDHDSIIIAREALAKHKENAQ